MKNRLCKTIRSRRRNICVSILLCIFATSISLPSQADPSFKVLQTQSSSFLDAITGIVKWIDDIGKVVSNEVDKAHRRKLRNRLFILNDRLSQLETSKRLIASSFMVDDPDQDRILDNLARLKVDIAATVVEVGKVRSEIQDQVPNGKDIERKLTQALEDRNEIVTRMVNQLQSSDHLSKDQIRDLREESKLVVIRVHTAQDAIISLTEKLK